MKKILYLFFVMILISVNTYNVNADPLPSAGAGKVISGNNSTTNSSNNSNKESLPSAGAGRVLDGKKATTNATKNNNKESKECKNLLGEDTSTGKYIRDIYNILKFAVPLIFLGLSVMDFGRGVLAQDNGEIKKATKRFGTRLIITILILILPTILNFILDLFDINTCTL